VGAEKEKIHVLNESFEYTTEDSYGFSIFFMELLFRKRISESAISVNRQGPMAPVFPIVP
jgi:hypothetical protein